MSTDFSCVFHCDMGLILILNLGFRNVQSVAMRVPGTRGFGVKNERKK